MSKGSKRKVTVLEMKDSFPLFLRYVWAFLQLPPPTPKQLEMAQWLQDGVPEMRQILMAFRGIGKSWVTCAFVVWCLWRNPQEKVELISASSAKADAFSIMAKRLISEIPFLKHLKPDPREHPSHRWSNTMWDVAPARIAQDPSVKAVGITGQITGTRATILILDDVEVPENSATVMMREKLLAKVLEIEAILSPGGRVIFLGTPQTEESIYKVLREKGYITRIWPARVPQPEKLVNYNGCLAPSIESLVGTRSGSATDTRFSLSELGAREARWGRSGFTLQFMLDTSLSDAEKYPLKLGDLVVLDHIDVDMGPVVTRWDRSTPDLTLKNIGFTGDYWYRPGYVPQENQKLAPWEGKLMAIDPSGRGEDECVGVVLYLLHGKLFFVDMYASKDGYGEETLMAFAKMAKRHKVNDIVIEANFGDGMFSQLMIPVLQKVNYTCAVEEVKHSTQKEKRIIDTLEPVMNQHRLVVDRKLVESDTSLVEFEVSKPYSLFYQMTRLTKERGALKNDDRVDALAIAVAYWIDSMSLNTDRAEEDWEAEQLHRSIEEFYELESPLVSLGNNRSSWGYGVSRQNMLHGSRPSVKRS